MVAESRCVSVPVPAGELSTENGEDSETAVPAPLPCTLLELVDNKIGHRECLLRHFVEFPQIQLGEFQRGIVAIRVVIDHRCGDPQVIR